MGAVARRPELATRVFPGVAPGVATAGAACLVLMRRDAASVEAWMALGARSLAVTAVVWPLFRTHGTERGGPRDAGPAAPRWDGDAVRLVVCYGAWGFGYIIPATFLPAMARARLDDPAVFGWAWPIFGMASVAATFGGGACSRRVGPPRLWRLSQVTMAVGVVLPVVWPGIVAIMGAALLVGSTFMVNTMSGMQEARRVHGAGARRLMAAMTAAFAAGQMLGPMAVSALAGEAAGFEPALIVAAVVLLAGAGGLRSPR